MSETAKYRISESFNGISCRKARKSYQCSSADGFLKPGFICPTYCLLGIKADGVYFECKPTGLVEEMIYCEACAKEILNVQVRGEEVGGKNE